MLKLYGQYRSRAFRVAWLCKESNIPYEHVNVTVNVEGATCKQPDYVQLNPNRGLTYTPRGTASLREPKIESTTGLNVGLP